MPVGLLEDVYEVDNVTPAKPIFSILISLPTDLILPKKPMPDPLPTLSLLIFKLLMMCELPKKLPENGLSLLPMQNSLPPQFISLVNVKVAPEVATLLFTFFCNSKS